MQHSLNFERTYNTDVLSSFFCGVRKIDMLIHAKSQGLSTFISDNDCEMYIVYYQDSPVAVFVYSETNILVNDKDYPSLEIDFIAVRQEFRRQGIGTAILRSIEDLAVRKGYHFLTVDAYYNKRYSAENFYLKCGFERNQHLPKQLEVVSMFKNV